MVGLPDGVKVKYFWDTTHFNIAEGGPENDDPTNCPGEENNSRPYDKDYVLASINCNVDACDAAIGTSHACRLHVQTIIVDEADRILAWSAGADYFYCIEGQSNCE